MEVKCERFKEGYLLVGKLCGCVNIDIECKNISISADIGDNIFYQIDRIWDTENIFVLGYLQPETESEIYQNKTW